MGISEVVPGGANREPSTLEPANWFSIDYETARAIAETAHEGDTRYGIENWSKGIPASNLINHALEHIFKALSGDRGQNHIAHAIWNLGKLIWMAKNKPAMIDIPALRRHFGTGETANWPDKPILP